MQHNKVQELGYWAQNFKYPLLFAIKHRRSTWVALFVFVFLYVTVCYGISSGPSTGSPSLLESLKKNWFSPDNHINIFIQLLTLFVVFFVWLTQLRQDWKTSLEKYLSVSFTFKGKPYEHLSAQYAPLFSESDIRNFGQSLGQVRYDGTRLPLDSERNELLKTICFDNSQKICCHPFWHYQITMPLYRALEKSNGKKTESDRKKISQ